HLKQQGFEEREVLHVEAGFKWEYLLECASALSLFAEKKLIEIRLASQKINKAASQILQQYLELAPPENKLLIIADKLDAGAKKSAWFKQIDQQGLIVEIWPVDEQQLPNWLQQRARTLNLQLNSDAIAMLAERVEGNLLAAKQELDKLVLLQGEQQLSAEDIVAAVSDSSRYDVFGLMDAIVAGQSERALKILQVLSQEGVEPSIILWAFSREIRLIHSVNAGLQQGQSYESLCTKLRIWGSKKRFLKQAAGRQKPRLLEQMLAQCSQIDQIIKGLAEGDSWVIFNELALKLSGKPFQLTS
ncbi:MAG: DNA polymerase III subunit delta, partial [Pseudomonadales bacterium]